MSQPSPARRICAYYLTAALCAAACVFVAPRAFRYVGGVFRVTQDLGGDTITLYKQSGEF